MYLRNYGLPKTWLDKYQISTASQYRWTSNMVNRLKTFSNVNSGTFILFIDPCEGNCVKKSHSYRYAKSWDCLLTQSLPMLSILFLIENI